MGHGNDVAKDAASIILLDEDFNAIIKGILWGRNVYESVK